MKQDYINVRKICKKQFVIMGGAEFMKNYWAGRTAKDEV